MSAHGAAATSEPVRVVHLVKGLGPGGAEQLILDQLRTADREAFDYHVMKVLDHKDHLVPAIEALGVPVRSLGAGWSWPLRLRKALRSLEPDIVHAHSPVLAIAARVLRRSGAIPGRVVTTEHNRWPRHHPITRFFNRLTARFDGERIAVSDDVRESMSPAVRATTATLRHGIPIGEVAATAIERDDVRSELGLAAEDVVVGIVANFRPEKAYDTFLAAARTALDRSETLRFVVVGQGPGEEAFRTAVASKPSGDRIDVLGYRADARRVIAGFDVFTLTSRHEGLPVSLMEALALGRPIVATRAGGIPEAIVDGDEGLLVDIDDVDGIADAWLRLAEDSALRVTMGQAAREAASAFDASVSTREIESSYRRLMTGSG